MSQSEQWMTRHYLGFSIVEDLCEESIVDRTVYVQPVRVTTAESMGIASQYLMIQAMLPGDVVGYVRILVGQFNIANGRAFDDEAADAVYRRLQDATDVMREWLAERGFRVVRATFAAPRDFRLISGSADFLDYNLDTDTFVRKHVGEGVTA